MSLWTPPAEIALLDDGEPLPASIIKNLTASLQVFLNGLVGNSNINTALDAGDKIAYAKLALAGSILDSDIASVGLDKFATLKVTAQASPNNTVLVAAGKYPSASSLVTLIYAGGSSGAFPNTSGAGLNRIDVLTINDSGTLEIISGAEAASPTAPAYLPGKTPLVEVYIRYNAGGVVIRNTDNGSDSYIKLDPRPILSPTLPVQMEKASATDNQTDPGTTLVDLANMSLSIGIGAVQKALIIFNGTFRLGNTTGNPYPQLELALLVGGVNKRAAIWDYEGNATAVSGYHQINASLMWLETGLSAGSHTCKVQWRRADTPAGTPYVSMPGGAQGGRNLAVLVMP